ncbi:Hypothetical protein NocV09_00601800 [Nannochloropsis oceanica]
MVVMVDGEGGRKDQKQKEEVEVVAVTFLEADAAATIGTATTPTMAGGEEEEEEEKEEEVEGAEEEAMVIEVEKVAWMSGIVVSKVAVVVVTVHVGKGRGGGVSGWKAERNERIESSGGEGGGRRWDDGWEKEEEEYRSRRNSSSSSSSSSFGCNRPLSSLSPASSHRGGRESGGGGRGRGRGGGGVDFGRVIREGGGSGDGLERRGMTATATAFGGRGRRGRGRGGGSYRVEWEEDEDLMMDQGKGRPTATAAAVKREEREGGRIEGTCGLLRRGVDLPLDEVEVGGEGGREGGRVYQGAVYAAHEVHGIFIYFGMVVKEEREGRDGGVEGGAIRFFEASGRITRSGLPALVLEDLEKKAEEGRRGGREGGGIRRETLVEVRVKSVERPLGGKPKVELVLVPRRKLLILDLNGVLFNRYPVGDARREGGRGGWEGGRVIKRPGCDDFLEFCFAHFDVAAWSCCRKETLEMEIFNGREKELVFVNWGMHSTNLWPRHSAVSKDKPLFLKELRRLWEGQLERVGYGEQNTILLDNHVEKFEGNPVGTCVVVPEYEDGAEPEDGVLSLEGELVGHLRRMAVAPEGGRGEEGGGGVRDMAIQLRRKGLREVVKEGGKEGGASHVVCEKSDGVRLFLCVLGEGGREGLRKAGGGGADGYLIDRHWGVEVLEGDGGREGGKEGALGSVLSPGGGMTLLDGELLMPLREGGREGGSEEGKEGGTFLFLVFDVIFLDGKDVGAEPLLATRMQALSNALASIPSSSSPSSSSSSSRLVVGFRRGSRAKGSRVEIVPKVFHDLADLPGMVETMMTPVQKEKGEGRTEEEAEEFIFDDGRRRSFSDGLVFTPSSSPYYLYQVHKFKTPGRISVDFKMKKADLFAASRTAVSSLPSLSSPSPSFLRPPKVAPLYLVVAKHDMKFTTLDLLKNNALKRLIDHFEGVGEGGREGGGARGAAGGECIVECDLARGSGGGREGGGLWVLRGIRGDKASPNSILTAWHNLEAVAEALTLEKLVREVEQLRLAPPEEEEDEEEEGGEGEVNDVARHYDKLQEKRWEEGEEALDSRVHNLRRLNNWIKSVLIERTCSGDGEGWKEEEQKRGGMLSIGEMPNPLATAEARDAAVAGGRREGGREKGHVSAVLDVACGRGGDFKKWMMQGVETYVGFDCSELSVKECRSRVEEQQRKSRRGGRAGGQPRVGVVFQCNMTEERLVECIEEEMGGEGVVEGGFDVVSIQFAVHYACVSEEALSSLLGNVKRLLKGGRDGGLLILTCIDDRVLRQHLTLHPEGAFGNAVYRVTFAPEVLQRQQQLQQQQQQQKSETKIPPLDTLGLRYNFTLSSAVEACDEYVVPVPAFERVARQAGGGGGGLKLVYQQNFGGFVKEHLKNYGRLLEPLQVGVVSGEEWEAIQLYKVMVFRKE